MISLFIDTSSVSLIVSIVRDKKVIAFSKIEDLKNISTQLLVEISSHLEKNRLSITDVDTIFIINGPGSFTGLRVGVTVAKTLAYTLHKKIIPLSSLEFMATTDCKSDYIVPYIDARRGFVYAGVYDKELNNVMKDTYISVTELMEKVKDMEVTFVGYTKVEKIDCFQSPKENILKILLKHENDTGEEPHKVNPNYLKMTEAEEKKGV